MKTSNIKAIIFDWGDTLMKDFPEYNGPMVNWPKVAVMPGVHETLERLHREYILCAASNAGDSDAKLMGEALARGGIRRFFRYLFTSKELGYSKPDVKFFEEITKRIKYRPEECLMVGNDYKNDIVPAKSAGMKTLLISNRDLISEFPDADKVGSSIQDISEILIY